MVDAVSPELLAAYADHGLAVTAPKGAAWHCDTMVCAEYDGVPYCIDANGKPENLDRVVLHRKLTIERHHALVKQVYDYCVGLGVGDIWVMCGGGSQLQAFFGNHTGYLAILYLDHEVLRAPEPDDEDDGLFTLQVNWERNDPLFEGRFAVDGVRLSTWAEVYGS